MNEKRDFSEIGNQIKRVLQEAAETGDFGQVNRVINDTVSSAMEEVRHQVNEAHRRMNGSGNAGQGSADYRNSAGQRSADYRNNAGQGSAGYRDNAGQRSTDYSARYRRQAPKYPNRHAERAARHHETVRQYETAREYRRASGVPVYRNTEQITSPAIFRKNGNVAGILYTVFGGIGLGVFGITFLVFLLIQLFSWGLSAPGPFVAPMTGFGLLAAGSGYMLNKGCSLLGRLKRAQRYLNLAQKDMFMKIEELAAHTGQSMRRVRRDIRLMLKSGIFPQGHIDEEETFLILDNETWDQYLIEKREFQESRQIAKADKAKAAKTAPQEEALSPEQQAQQEIERDGQAFMQRLRELNVEIPGEVISNRLYQLDYLLQRIFMVLKEHPEKCPQMRKFMDYYLPTTVKLVESYADFDKAGVQGENIKTAKAEIEKTMDTINQAFEKLLDDMYQDAAFEAAADAKVLKTVLAQDGYMKSDFTAKKQDSGMQKEGEK